MKKAILILLLSLLAGLAFAQPDGVFRIDSLPPEDILLNQGWKWYAGDDPDFARPAFDDSGWEWVSPLKVIDSLPQNLRSSGIHWLRLKLQLDKSLSGDILALAIEQTGASEIYLNGKLVQTYGLISTNPDETKAYNPLREPIPFSIPQDSLTVIAVRYASLSNIPAYLRSLPNLVGPKITLNTLEAIQSSKNTYFTHLHNSNIFRIGAFLILCMSYFALYLYYPVKKENLFFCLFSLCLLTADFIQLKLYNNYWIAEFGILNGLFFVWIGVAKVFLLAAVYFLMNQKISWGFLFLSSLISLGFIFDIFIYHPVMFLLTVHVFPNLVNLEIVRITLKSIRDERKGAWIIAAGGIAFLISAVIFVLSFYLNFIDTPILGSLQTIGDLVYNVNWLCIPVAVAIYSGLEIALTNRILKEKLSEVEQLSMEKQQILAEQNETLERQVAERTAALKASQSQLIQSEKLASLGELTAGIAHEIQNPLNFVNNFAEVSAEMIDELTEELTKGDTSEAQAIAQDLKGNLEKINHHGQRASGIVKSMLEHSRTSSGTKEPTNLNALADEYLRLAYHGLRAKDSSFNAEYELIADPNLPKVHVVPQDMGRVLLNLINNAFYACAERSRSAVNEKAQQGIIGYQPKVTIQTRWLSDAEAPDKGQIEIRVKDNGSGIPEAIREKIFQPFFTTKPTGQGTGLGLSLSYDIVTKGHGGRLEVHSTPGEGSEFCVFLPHPA